MRLLALFVFCAGFMAGPADCLGRDLAPATLPHVQFKEPRATGYRIEVSTVRPQSFRAASPSLVKAWPDTGSTNAVYFSSRIVLQLALANTLTAVLDDRPVQVDRTLDERIYILQAPDAVTAIRQAAGLAQDPRVLAAYPVAHRPKQLLEGYAVRPNDPLFFRPDQPQDQWQANLENRDTNGAPQGVDLNVRKAWPITRGEGVVLAIADDGVEVDHPDLAARTVQAPHFNFITGVTNGNPVSIFSSHATAVAGLAAATSDNGVGVAGVAPRATVASWVIFGANDNLVSDEALMDMFQYQSNIVDVQNHSWGKVGIEQLRVTSLEDLAIQHAVDFGRGGRGIIIVRAGGNGREEGNDANEDGYLADPRTIAVAAVRVDGRFTRYSAPGACILVAAPSGDMSPDVADPCLSDSPNMTTTDRQGDRGYNQRDDNDSGDYTFGTFGFSGTSAATPQISGVVTLILAANPELTYRDVQQILALSSRHYDLSDPTLVVNGAGLLVSHNVGYGVPDAGQAVKLARTWTNRPPITRTNYSFNISTNIPEDGLLVQLDGVDVPENLRAIRALPGSGPHPIHTTSLWPVVDVGNALEPITDDLHGKAALIQRGQTFFCQKLAYAMAAGAELAIVYNNIGGDDRIFMVETDRSAIPSVFISQNDGEALRDYLTAQPDARVQLGINAATCSFEVSDDLICEHIGVRLNTDHTARGDLRIVLTSPAGTQSILQRANRDSLSGPDDWTYYTVQHFYESSHGTWTLSIIDEDTKGTGSLLNAELIIAGVAIEDSDHDGLADDWELRHFKSLSSGPKGDSDLDGYVNAVEQVIGTNPAGDNSPLQLDLSVWDSRLARLSWPSNTNTLYRVQIGSDSPRPLSLLTNVPGSFPETEWFVPYTNVLHEFFRVQAVPNGN